MKSREAWMRQEILPFLLGLLIVLLAFVSLYGLDCAYPLEITEIVAAMQEGDRAAAGELVVYAHAEEAGTQLQSYLLHPFKSGPARCAAEKALAPGEDAALQAKGFWFRYTVRYEAERGSILIQKQLHTRWKTFLTALAVYLLRQVYVLAKRRKRTAQG